MRDAFASSGAAAIQNTYLADGTELLSTARFARWAVITRDLRSVAVL